MQKPRHLLYTSSRLGSGLERGTAPGLRFRVLGFRGLRFEGLGFMGLEV